MVEEAFELPDFYVPYPARLNPHGERARQRLELPLSVGRANRS